MNELFEIIYEDEELLLINKPAGLVCHPTKGDAYSSLISRVRLYLGNRPSIHMVNRLDRETSGLVLIAKTDLSARAMRRRWEAGNVRKAYLAVVEGQVRDLQSEIDLPIGPDTKSVVAIKGCVRPDGARSQTRFQRLHCFRSEGRDYSLLNVEPCTGRKHQIRIHLAHLGHPIVGDKLYGWDEQCYLAFVEGRLDEAQARRLRLRNHALHASGLEWEAGNEFKGFVARATPEFQEFIALGTPSLELPIRGLKVDVPLA